MKYVVSITIYKVSDEQNWDIEDMETLGEYDSYEEAKTNMDTFPWLRYPSDGSGIPNN